VRVQHASGAAAAPPRPCSTARPLASKFSLSAPRPTWLGDHHPRLLLALVASRSARLGGQGIALPAPSAKKPRNLKGPPGEPGPPTGPSGCQRGPSVPFTRQSTEAGACRGSGPPAAKCNDKTQQQRGSLTGVPLLVGRSKLQACARCTDTLFEQKKRARRTWDAQLLLGRPGLFAYRCQGKCDATRARSMYSTGRQGEPCHRVQFVLGRPPVLRRGATDERTTSASECTMSQRQEATQNHPLRHTKQVGLTPRRSIERCRTESATLDECL
jgi:hypothetical protein